MVFKMENNKVGAGMGTSGLVGQFGTIATMGGSGWVGIVTLHFLLPALLSTLFCLILLKVKKIRPGDMRL